MSNRRILHLVKTLDGATWAFHQIRGLVEQGWDVHVAAPTGTGRHLPELLATGAKLHVLPVEFPATRPWKISTQTRPLRELVRQLQPRLVHSHFVSCTLLARQALRDIPIPRLFQVPGPLHLEHSLFGTWETAWADAQDHWIASSEFIRQLYWHKYHLPHNRVHLSYYGIDPQTPPPTDPFLRQRLGIPHDAFVVGNVSYFYPPKWFLGQGVGIKGHELMLEALAPLLRQHPNLWMVFIGSQWGGGTSYFEKIRREAQRIGLGRVAFTGHLPAQEVMQAWREIDLACHMPLSENCGGVVEPLLMGTPVLCAEVGGLPEVILNQQTGLLAARTPEALRGQLEWALSHPTETQRQAQQGQARVRELFDRKRTSEEVHRLYLRLLGNY